MQVFPRLAWAALAACVIVQSFVPPVVGLADNADFGKVLGLYSLGGPPELHGRFVAPRLTVEERFSWLDSPFRTSERLFLAAAVHSNKLISTDGSMDVRVMGAVHALLLLGIFWLLAPELGAASAAAAAIFGDVMYITHLNSFHMDVVAWLGLLGMAAFYLRAVRGGKWVDWLGFAAASATLVLSKSAHAPLGLVLAAVALVWRRYAIAGVWLAGAWWMFAGTPAGYAPPASYNVLYHRLLPASENPPADLAELGVAPEMIKYRGTYVYQAGSGGSDPAAQVSHAKLAAYYLRHPLTAWRHLALAMDEGSRLRHALGNFTPDSGRAELEESQTFTQWSGPKRWLFEKRGARLVWAALVLFSLSAAWALRDLSSPLSPMFLALPAMGLTELAIAGLADTLEVARHMFVFHAICDLLLVLLIRESLVQYRNAAPGLVPDPATRHSARRPAASPD